MNGIQVYNLVWLCVWLVLGAGAMYGVIDGNWAHCIFVCAAAYFSYLLFTDKEDGESLKEFAIRKIKAHKEGR